MQPNLVVSPVVGRRRAGCPVAGRGQRLDIGGYGLRGVLAEARVQRTIGLASA